MNGISISGVDQPREVQMMRIWRSDPVYVRRLIVVLLVALAVGAAPLGAALAGSHLAAYGTADRDAAVPADPDMSSVAGLTDCDKMMGTSGAADCPCCDPQKACPPEACLAKCYKVFGDLPRPLLVSLFVAQRFDAAEPDRPPKRSVRPDTPPPRT